MTKPAIYTEYVSPPIPTRDQDWYARFEFHDGDTDLSGSGPTERKAVIGLLISALDCDDEKVSDAIIVMATIGWESTK